VESWNLPPLARMIVQLFGFNFFHFDFAFVKVKGTLPLTGLLTLQGLWGALFLLTHAV
jgi:hypothetical protein